MIKDEWKHSFFIFFLLSFNSLIPTIKYIENKTNSSIYFIGISDFNNDYIKQIDPQKYIFLDYDLGNKINYAITKDELMFTIISVWSNVLIAHIIILFNPSTHIFSIYNWSPRNEKYSKHHKIYEHNIVYMGIEVFDDHAKMTFMPHIGGAKL